MTKEEAARILDPETTADALAEIEYYGGFEGYKAKLEAVDAACELAVAALRDQAEEDKNEPLALEELREIATDGRYGCHIWVKDLLYGDVLAAITDKIDEQICAVWSYGEYDCYWEHDYGKTWIAYRRDPEDGTK